MPVRVRSPVGELTPERTQLDSIAVSVLWLDSAGRVTYANAAWRKFCDDNQQHALSRVGVGQPLLEILRSSGDAASAIMADGLADVVHGCRSSYDEVYRCHASRHRRWFRLQVRRTQGPEATTVLTQTDVTQERLAQARSRIQACVAESFIARKPLLSSCRDLACLACDELDWDYMGIWILDSSSWALRCVDVGYRGGLELSNFEASIRNVRLGPGKGLPGRAWQSRKPVWVTDRDTDPGADANGAGRDHTILPPSALEVGFRSGFAIPVKYDDDVLAVIEVLGFMRH